PNTIQVEDGMANLGSYVASTSIYARGTNAADSITVNFGADMFTGSLFINGRNGDDTTSVYATGGAIEGNITLLHSYGNESVALNSNSLGGLTVRGVTNVVTQYGQSSITLGGADSTVVNGATSFLGDVNLTGIDTIE